MSKARRATIAFAPRQKLLALSLAAWLGAFIPASAQAPQARYDNAKTAEGWAWSQIKQGKRADFNQYCNATSPLDPRAEEDARWRESCRRLSARFLQDLLTRAPWREATPFAGVRIAGARIVGDLDLENAKLIRPIEIAGSRIEGAIGLSHARTDSLIALDDALMLGDFSADGLQGDVDLYLRNGSTFKSAVTLTGAKIAGDLDMTGARFEGPLNADYLKIGGSLFMRSDDRNQAAFNTVVLNDAKIAGQADMSGARVDGALKADYLQVGGPLFMRSDAQNKASFGDVVLHGAKIGGSVHLVGARFEGALNANSLQVGGSLHMQNADYAEKVGMLFAHVGANLDLRGATFAGLNLSGASVTGDLRLGGGPYKSVVWRGKNGEPGALDLRNARIGNLMDAKDAWPTEGHLRLDGFAFSDFGGYEGETGPQMRQRGSEWWDKHWARLDPDYSPVPYAQLATALTTSGDPDAANEIRYLSRVRERETEKGLAYLWLSVLQGVAGFGIGSYTFRVLYWVIGVSFLGAVYLKTRVKGVRDAGHNFFWCFGASLARLLPAIEINKEFTAFFDDPNRERLTEWQSFVFSAIRMAGWVFGLILLAAISGLTQGS